ncbi:MAG: hypothetical protein MJZ18_11150 [Bacteroidales bacterium]|nr:hypothetical protein [Bacteroidales bacterium]
MMDRLRAIHNDAMDLAQMAQIATRKGDADKADNLFLQAFEKEREAALMAYNDNHPQPGLSILLQSAAHLAVTCKQQREAEKLIGLALSGEAPSEIRQDLRQLLTTLDTSTDGQYETYTIQIPSGDKGILNALNLMLTRLGCSMKKIAVL